MAKAKAKKEEAPQEEQPKELKITSSAELRERIIRVAVKKGDTQTLLQVWREDRYSPPMTALAAVDETTKGQETAKPKK